MKELLKKASLTVATACLVAGGLVSVGWAYSDEGNSKRLPDISKARSVDDANGKSNRVWILGAIPTSANCAEKIEQQEPMPDELEINGQRYQKARSFHLDFDHLDFDEFHGVDLLSR